MNAPPRRTVHCQDAVAWLHAQDEAALEGVSFVTSIPDVSEITGLSLQSWHAWFVATAALIMRKCPPLGVAIFYQSDIRKDGRWVDKGHLCSKAAEEADARLLWHKIICRKRPGTITFSRAAYAHMLCFSRGLSLQHDHPSPDVVADGGPALWTRGMGTHSCELACRYVRSATQSHTVVDPFCGVGTVLAVANGMGLHTVGVELSAKRARKAAALQLPT